MSQTYVAAFISLLVVILPMFGIQVGSDQLTVTIQTIVVLVSQIWIMVRRHQVGDISVLGARK